MAEKPTYEELKQRVKELEKKVFKTKQTEKALRESEERYRTMLVGARRRFIRFWRILLQAGIMPKAPLNHYPILKLYLCPKSQQYDLNLQFKQVEDACLLPS